VLGAACATGTDAATRGDSYLSARRWQISVGYRKQRSHRHFVGTEEQHEREEAETEIVNDVHLFDVSATYAVSPRYSLSFSVPFMFAKRTRPGTLDRARNNGQPGPDQVFHSRGIGDISVSGRAWLIRPPSETRQNVSFGIGVKIPTGEAGVQDTVQTLTGPSRVVVDQSIQLGDGGWGLSLDVQGFKAVKRATLYGSGVYLLNPRNTNGVRTGRARASEAIMSVSDQYLARAGVVYPMPKVRHMSFSVGARLEGVPIRDLIGKSEGFRRPGYAISFEPGINYLRGKETWTLAVPIPFVRNRQRSTSDIIDNRHGDAAFADYVIMLGYSRRF
jgi:hypothetical protein